MKSNNVVEIILFPRYYVRNVDQKELVRWLGTTVQPMIEEQHDSVEKLYLQTLKDTPAIYLS